MALNHANIVLAGVVGNIETTATGDGKLIANISLGVHPGGKDRPTDWFQVKFFGKQAETLDRMKSQKAVGKGTPLFITGTPTFDRWKDKQTGEDRSRPVVIGSTWKFVESKATREAREAVREAEDAAAPFGDVDYPWEE